MSHVRTDPIDYIRDRARAVAGEPTFEPLGPRSFRQLGRGTTSYALAAYLSFRDTFRATPSATIVVGISEGDAANQLVRLETPAGVGLLLDGVSWGYGGTGPNGLAAILADLGFFAGDRREALRYVSELDPARGFRLAGAEV